jgi:hypothetical protein
MASDPDPESASAEETASRRRVPPRTVLLGVIATVIVAFAMYAIAPWILPVRVYEGPLVQMATEDGVTLIWYMTRSADCAVTVVTGDGAREVPAESDGRRCRVRIDGLQPDATYPYEIHAGDRALTDRLEFRTSKPPATRYSFLVFGDSGSGTRAQYALAERMVATLPAADFLLHTGDQVYGDGARRDYLARFFRPYRRLIARVNFWPCAGNHDVNGEGLAPALQEIFETPDNGPPGLPEDLNYWFDYASCRVAVINSNADVATLRDKVAPWLATVMADPQPAWRFVSLHHPPHTAGKYEPDLAVLEHLVPVFEATGVDVVFSGHDHMYQRFHPLRGGAMVEPGAGVVYVVTGAGGRSLYTPRHEAPPELAVLVHDRFSFTQIVIAGAELTLRQIAADGTVLDDYTFAKLLVPTSMPTTVPVDAAR